MAHLNIIARLNGVGLDRDVDLVREVAEDAGHQVTVSHCRSISPVFSLLPQASRFDANIFIERVFTRWLGAASTNILIPNQERFPERHLPRLEKIDHVFCKTAHALAAFRPRHPSCHHVSFTSPDLHDPEIPRKPHGILHLAGRSTLKGTSNVLAVWKNHPEWPELTLLQHKENAPSAVPANVTLITDYLPDDALTRLINAHPFHLCPSESEGWGHYIVEAMSCGAVVITTDAPPMNELVAPDRGILVDWDKSGKRHLGTNFQVSPESLEAAVEQALHLTDEETSALGAEARSWMQRNDATFRENMTRLLGQVLKPRPAPK